MNIMGDRCMTAQQVIDTCKETPKREDIVKNDTAKNSYWQPVSHSNFVDAMYQAFEKHDIEVIDSSFALNKKRGGEDGHLLVGGFKVKGAMLPKLPNDIDGVYEVLCRHANDMSRRIQLNAGVELMVCTNGCMSGEQIATRKHTNGFDIYEWANDQAIGGFVESCNKQVQFIESLRETECSDKQADAAIVRALREGWMPAARVRDVAREWENPVFDTKDFPLNTAYKLYGDFTHVAQECNADTQLRIVEESSKLVQEICVPNLAVAL
jgi:hypothetical protein